MFDFEEPIRWRQGTIRSRTPAETMQGVEPLLANYGITRVAMVSGLDRSPIPVALAIRPAAKTISVSAGKGMSAEMARLSAIMESIEVSHAENVRPADRICGWRDFLGGEIRLHPRTLPAGPRSKLLDDNFSLEWIRIQRFSTSIDLGRAGAETVYAPRAYFDLAMDLSGGMERGLFRRSSNGLASGNSLVEALLHGIFEVLERDAVSTFMSLPSEQKRELAIGSFDLFGDEVVDLLNSFKESGYRFSVYSLASRFGVPAFALTLAEENSLRSVPPISGSGCHLDPSIALLRAATEAMQGRLTFITGTREDNTRLRYERTERGFLNLLERFEDQLAGASLKTSRLPTGDGQFRGVSFNGSLTECLRRLVAKLNEGGIEHVNFLCHTLPSSPFQVVHVLIPGLANEP